jgi:hypothetical protein
MKVTGPLDERDKHRLVLKLLTKLRCLTCGQPYNLRDFTMVDRKKDTWVLSSQCQHCGHSGHVVAVVSLDGKLEPSTDLTPEETEDLAELPAITTDDVLDIYAFMQEFDGDFETLFTQ